MKIKSIIISFSDFLFSLSCLVFIRSGGLYNEIAVSLAGMILSCLLLVITSFIYKNEGKQVRVLEKILHILTKMHGREVEDGKVNIILE